MPILDSILDHDLLGPAILQGRLEGRQEIVRLILGKRLGVIPDWAEARLSNLPAGELDGIADRAPEAA